MASAVGVLSTSDVASLHAHLNLASVLPVDAFASRLESESGLQKLKLAQVKNILRWLKQHAARARAGLPRSAFAVSGKKAVLVGRAHTYINSSCSSAPDTPAVDAASQPPAAKRARRVVAAAPPAKPAAEVWFETMNDPHYPSPPPPEPPAPAPVPEGVEVIGVIDDEELGAMLPLSPPPEEPEAPEPEFLDPDVISARGGVQKLIEDVGVDGMDGALLVFAFRCEAELPCVFERANFLKGCSSLGITDAASFSARLASMRRTLTDGPSPTRDELYAWTFRFLRAGAQESTGHHGLKNVLVDDAAATWPLLLPEWPLVNDFAAFLTSETNSQKHISQDSWALVAEFAQRHRGPTPKALAASYDESAPENCSWPVLLDEFVEYCQSQKA